MIEDVSEDWRDAVMDLEGAGGNKGLGGCLCERKEALRRFGEGMEGEEEGEFEKLEEMGMGGGRKPAKAERE